MGQLFWWITRTGSSPFYLYLWNIRKEVLKDVGLWLLERPEQKIVRCNFEHNKHWKLSSRFVTTRNVGKVSCNYLHCKRWNRWIVAFWRYWNCCLQPRPQRAFLRPFGLAAAFLEVDMVFHPVLYCIATRYSALKKLPRPYCMQSDLQPVQIKWKSWDSQLKHNLSGTPDFHLMLFRRSLNYILIF